MTHNLIAPEGLKVVFDINYGQMYRRRRCRRKSVVCFPLSEFPSLIGRKTALSSSAWMNQNSSAPLTKHNYTPHLL